MKLRVRLFAGAKQLVGHDTVEVELSEEANATVARLRKQLLARYPALTPLAGRCLFAVDNEYVAEDQQLDNGTEVACIPPVSGG